jgi:hypothetical protein
MTSLAPQNPPNCLFIQVTWGEEVDGLRRLVAGLVGSLILALAWTAAMPSFQCEAEQGRPVIDLCGPKIPEPIITGPDGTYEPYPCELGSVSTESAVYLAGPRLPEPIIG